MLKETIAISLGGSIIVPDEINWKLLKAFGKLILRHSNKKRFVIVTGGGKTARRYIHAADKLGAGREEKDWLGICATRINAKLAKVVFGKKAHLDVVRDPTKTINTKKNIIIAAGYKPGYSTDSDAVLLAKTLKAKTLINLTNVDYVYKRNPIIHKNQKPIKKLSWKEFGKIVGRKWVPGANIPFDPYAVRLAEKLKLKVYMLNGRKIKNLDNFLKGKKFIGSVVS